jgi:LPPG:FO 2-phospho-L-lactate transferase
LRSASSIVIAPSNPLVSIAPILSIKEIHDEVVERRATVVAISPIVGGKAIKGPADHMMEELGHEASVLGIGKLVANYASTLVIDRCDDDKTEAIEALGLRVVVTDTIMATLGRATALANTVLSAKK